MSAVQPTRRRPVQSKRPAVAVKSNANTRVQERSTWHWSLTLTLCFFFPSGIAILAYEDVTMIDWTTLILSVLCIGAVAAMAQYSWFKRMRKEKNEGDHLVIGKQLYFAYNFLGIGFLGTALMLTLNFFVIVGEPVVVVHKIAGMDKDYVASSYTGIVYLLEEDAYADETDLRWFDVSTNTLRQTHPYIIYEFHTGLFGFDNIGDRYLSADEKGTNKIEQPYL